VRQAFEREYEQIAQGERVSKIIHETYIQEMKRFKDKLRQLDEQQREQAAEEERLAEEALKKAELEA
jgi:hypothetical protein